MPIKKIKAQSPDPYVGKIAGDTEFARLAHLNNLVDQINSQAAPPPPPSTNIYNTDGTLTGNRTVFGSNTHSIAFANITNFSANANDGIESGLVAMNRLGVSFLQQSNSLNTSVNIRADFQYIQLSRAQNNSPFDGTYLKIDLNRFGTANTLTNFITNNFNGLDLNFSARTYLIGQISGFNNTYLNISDINRQITTFYNGNANGLQFNFNTRSYSFGQITGGNQTRIEIDDVNQNIKLQSFNNNLRFNFDALNRQLQTIINIGGSDRIRGLNMNLFSNSYYFGVVNNIDTNVSYLSIEGSSNELRLITDENTKNYRLNILPGSNRVFLSQNLTGFTNAPNGFDFNLSTRVYQLGQLTGGNTTRLTIDDTAAYPVQVSGTNISANTAGAASGQFLKIKVGGVDYKIALLNP